MQWAKSRIEIIFLILAAFVLITILKSLFIPLAFAFILAVFTQPLVQWLQEKKFPKWASIPIVIAITLGIVAIVVAAITFSFADLQSQQEGLTKSLESKFQPVIEKVNETGKKIAGPKFDVEKSIKGTFNKGFFKNAASSALTTVAGFASAFFVFAFYYIVLLVGLSGYKDFIRYVSDGDDSEKALEEYEKIYKKIHGYIKVKILIAAASSVLTTILLLAFGVKFALLFGLLTFFLDLIPFIGAIFSMGLPIIMALIQFDSMVTVMLVFVLLLAIQYGIGNVLEPIMMGESLNLNKVATMFSLVLWGYMWGAAGALIGLPLMVIFKLLLEQSDELAPLGRVMGTPEGNKQNE